MNKRNDFICNLVYSLKGNTLCLFQYVEKHGFVLYTLMKERVENLHYVYGGTDTEDREVVREIVEKNKDVVFFTYKTIDNFYSHNFFLSNTEACSYIENKEERKIWK